MQPLHTRVDLVADVLVFLHSDRRLRWLLGNNLPNVVVWGDGDCCAAVRGSGFDVYCAGILVARVQRVVNLKNHKEYYFCNARVGALGFQRIKNDKSGLYVEYWMPDSIDKQTVSLKFPNGCKSTFAWLVVDRTSGSTELSFLVLVDTELLLCYSQTGELRLQTLLHPQLLGRGIENFVQLDLIRGIEGEYIACLGLIPTAKGSEIVLNLISIKSRALDLTSKLAMNDLKLEDVNFYRKLPGVQIIILISYQKKTGTTQIVLFEFQLAKNSVKLNTILKRILHCK